MFFHFSLLTELPMAMYHPVMMHDQFRKKRIKLGYSQVEMAEAFGVDKSTVSRWEAGLRKIPAMAERLLKTINGRRVS